jgi:hypothetical protein
MTLAALLLLVQAPPPLPQAPPLPPPAGEVVRVSDVQGLYAAADRIPAGGTILVEDGLYELPTRLTLAKDGVTLRSASGDRTRVVFDGTKNRHGELVGLQGSDLTLADVTLQNIRWNAVKIVETGTHRALIWNCVLRNVWQRGVKASLIKNDRRDLHPRACRVQFCLFVNDRPKRMEDDEGETFGGNYIGGMDVKSTIGWTISDNAFVGIQGMTREGRGAVYISEAGTDVVIERNVFVDCDIAVALGNPTLEHNPVQALRCVVRNNFITRCPETGILADYTKDCVIAHNTIHDPRSRRRRLILIQHENPGLQVLNNLLSGPDLQNKSGEEVRLSGNVVRPDLAEAFMDAARGDLRLRGPLAGVTDAAERLALTPHDILGRPRLDRPDVGAHELFPAAGPR